MVRFECGKNDDSRTWLDKVFWTRTHVHFYNFERSYKYCNTVSWQFDRNYSFEDVNLFNFETDNLNVNDVIKWIYTTQDLQNILSDTKEWFRFRRWDLVWEQVSASSDYWYSKTLWKGSRKEFQKPCGCLSFTQAGVYIRLGYSSYVNGHI